MVQVAPKELENSQSEAKINVKKPKRVLHFSDGTIEEYSSDSDGDESPSEVDNTIAVPETWGPWFLYKLRSTGQTTLAVCDYLGESIASFLGITTPKYQWELDEFEKIEREKQELEEQKKGWIVQEENQKINTSQPVGSNEQAPTQV